MSDIWAMSDGKILVNVHDPEECFGHFCPLHHPSDHPLNKHDLKWTNGMMWRICDHGLAHPDPDDLSWRLRTGQPVESIAHLCCMDDCCGGPPEGYHGIEIEIPL